jgi:RimJ/RimL family protein N-acetyltransferase
VHLLYGHDKTVSDFVASLIPNCERGFSNCRAIGVLDPAGMLVAGVVYHDWNPEAGVIEMSCAAITPKWLTRPILSAIFSYPFRIGCQMIVFRVSASNKRLHRQFRSLGFRSYPIPRLYGRTEDGIIFTLTDDQWAESRFLRSEQRAASISQR